MQKRDFETYQKRFWDFEILPKFSDTHVFATPANLFVYFNIHQWITWEVYCS